MLRPKLLSPHARALAIFCAHTAPPRPLRCTRSSFLVTYERPRGGLTSGLPSPHVIANCRETGFTFSLGPNGTLILCAGASHPFEISPTTFCSDASRVRRSRVWPQHRQRKTDNILSMPINTIIVD